MNPKCSQIFQMRESRESVISDRCQRICIKKSVGEERKQTSGEKWVWKGFFIAASTHLDATLATYSSCREGMSANIPSVISDMDPLTKLLSAHRHKQHNHSSGIVHCGSANCDAACRAQHIISSYSQRSDVIRDGPGDLRGTDTHDGVLGAGAS